MRKLIAVGLVMFALLAQAIPTQQDRKYMREFSEQAKVTRKLPKDKQLVACKYLLFVFWGVEVWAWAGGQGTGCGYGGGGGGAF